MSRGEIKEALAPFRVKSSVNLDVLGLPEEQRADNQRHKCYADGIHSPQ